MIAKRAALTHQEAIELEGLAYRALDALRDQDRAAVELVTSTDSPDHGQLVDEHRRLVHRAQVAEHELRQAIWALTATP